MQYYDYRSYFQTLINQTDELEQNTLDLFSRVDDLYTLLAVILALLAGILAYLMIKNWRFRK